MANFMEWIDVSEKIVSTAEKNVFDMKHHLSN